MSYVRDRMDRNGRRWYCFYHGHVRGIEIDIAPVYNGPEEAVSMILNMEPRPHAMMIRAVCEICYGDCMQTNDESE